MKESFTIPITEWKTVDVGKNTIRIRGTALEGDVVSKNQRKYLNMEVAKSTNTFIGKPLTVNHDDNRKIGHLTWMDYADGLLTFEAEVTKQPYVDMLRDHSTEIKGFSIQADYLFNKCTRCGKRFYTEQDFHTHMVEEEYIRDISAIPHGMIGSALSMVLSPEIPGYDGTSYEIMEMKRREILRLSETITKDYIERENYMNELSKAGIAISQQSTVTAPAIKETDLGPQPDPNAPLQPEDKPIISHECPAGQHWDDTANDGQGGCVDDIEADGMADPNITEQEEETPAEPPQCEDGYHWDSNEEACVPDEVSEQEEHQCGEGEHWDGEKCVPDAPPEAQEQEETPTAQVDAGTDSAQPHTCPDGQHWDEEVQACVNDTPKQPLDQLAVECNCPAGEHWDGEKCVANTGETVTIRESKIGAFEWKPIRFETFESILKETKDEVLAGQRVKQNRQINETLDNLASKINEIIKTVNTPVQVKMPFIDESWKKHAKTLALNDKHIMEQVNKVPADDKSWRQGIDKNRKLISAEAKKWQSSADKNRKLIASETKNIQENVKQNRDRIIKESSNLAFKLENLPKPKPFNDDLSWRQSIEELKKEVSGLPNLQEQIKELEQKHEALKEGADKRIKEYYDQNLKASEEKDTKIDKLEKELKETKQLAETLQTNVKEKLHGNFKGQADAKIKETVVHHASDPLKEV